MAKRASTLTMLGVAMGLAMAPVAVADDAQSEPLTSLEPVSQESAARDAPPADLVRLPGRGEVKIENRQLSRQDRLAPGGGLLMSFDGDRNGAVSPAEFETGLVAAFASADDNGDGQLTVFEQRDWAQGLPTRDDSLSNPVRFDPNLDRMVSFEEFSTVIRNLASPYQDEIDGTLDLAQLRQTAPDRPNAPEPRQRRPEDPFGRDRTRDPRSPRPS